MARSWLIDSRGLARKVKSANLPSAHQIKDCGANRECPNCHYRIDNSDVFQEWPGLPAGVKFDPSDVELVEHLAAKCGVGDSKPHMFIDEFIPTIDGDEGICYTHPENLPGAKRDGNSVHFFYRTINAYATGQRKRRRIHAQDSLLKEHVRWHKTGKTKPVIINGVQTGFKKIMVLYLNSKKNSKPDKSNWVMHQYHLGTDEDEKEGEYVVSKVFYQQPKQTDKNDGALGVEDLDIETIRTSPRTPKTVTPNPPRKGKSVSCDELLEENHLSPFAAQEVESMAGTSRPSSSAAAQMKDRDDYSAWLAGESQAVDATCMDDPLFCNEIFDFTPLGDPHHPSFTGFPPNTNEVATREGGDTNNLNCGISDDLDNIEHAFGSQDSIFGWLDML